MAKKWTKPTWRVSSQPTGQVAGYWKTLFHSENEQEARRDFARRRPRMGQTVSLFRGIFGVDRKVWRSEGEKG